MKISNSTIAERLNKSQIEFILQLNDFIPGIVFIINVDEGTFQFIDSIKVRSYGLHDQVLDCGDFLKTYFHPKEIERFEKALSRLGNNSLSIYSGIYRIRNTESGKWNFFYTTIKEMELLRGKIDNLFLGIAQDIGNLDVAKVQFNNMVEELDFINENKEKFEQLTKREKEILSCICDCKTNFEIGRDLFISQATVETHRKRIIKKLSARNSLDLLNYARVFDMHSIKSI